MPLVDEMETVKTENVRMTILEDLTLQSLQMYKDKNHDYGDSFYETWESLGEQDGIVSAFTRISDKYNRFKTWVTKLRHRTGYFVSDEKVKDTLIDLAVYCLMTVTQLNYLEINKQSEKKDSLPIQKGVILKEAADSMDYLKVTSDTCDTAQTSTTNIALKSAFIGNKAPVIPRRVENSDQSLV